MADTFTKDQRNSIMRKVKSSRNKSTELKMIDIFKNNSITGWRRNYKLFGKPDFVFSKQKCAVFIDGCFWHGHEGCRFFVIPKTRTDFWINKININIQNDKTISLLLENMGWRVIIVWECELKKEKREKTLCMLVNNIKNPN